jgi:serine/threonine-protein kinase
VCRFLDGKYDELKEYSIALDVFGREPTFDPKIDPIVRVEACRLRNRLNAYQQREARDDCLAIELSKRGYEPIIRTLIGRHREPTIAVLPFFDLSGNRGSDALIDALTEELIDLLTEVPGIKVSPRVAVLSFKRTIAGIQAIGDQLKAELLIEGSVRQIGTRIVVRARLVDVGAGLTQRLASYDHPLKSFPAMIEEIAQSIIAKLRLQFPDRVCDATEEFIDTA